MVPSGELTWQWKMAIYIIYSGNFPIKNGGSFHCYVARFTWIKPTILADAWDFFRNLNDGSKESGPCFKQNKASPCSNYNEYV